MQRKACLRWTSVEWYLEARHFSKDQDQKDEELAIRRMRKWEGADCFIQRKLRS